MRNKSCVLLVVLLLSTLASCASSYEQEIIDESNPTISMLQIRKIAYSQRYRLANKLYQTLKAKHPDDLALQVEIDYEIAFLYVKQKKYKTAKPKFEEIVARYELDQNSAELPQWPYYLSKKILDDVVLKKLEKKTFLQTLDPASNV